jgi:DNA-binding transcriptional regulator YiaG
MKKISAEEFDRKFDAGEDIDEYLDHSKASRPAIAALAQQAREATGLSQAAFAERYRIPLSTFFRIGNRASACQMPRPRTICA